MTRVPCAAETERLRGDLREKGWCVLEDAWTPAEAARIQSVLDRVLERERVFGFAGFGCKVFALQHEEPAMREFFAAPSARGFLEKALEDRVAFKMTGVRWSTEESDPRMVWHDHYFWDPGLLRSRERFERMSMLCYLDGSDEETGPLIASPRGFQDPIHVLSSDPCAPRPEEVEIFAPPRSLAFMDSAVYHCARRGTRPGVRTMWGGQAQAVGCKRPHPEDTDGIGPAFRALRRRLGLTLGRSRPAPPDYPARRPRSNGAMA